MSIPFGHVSKVICPTCKAELSPLKPVVPGHRPKGDPTASGDCKGSGATPKQVKDFGGRVHNWS